MRHLFEKLRSQQTSASELDAPQGSMQVSLPRHAKMGLAFMAMRETLGGPCGGICADEPGLGQIESLLGLTLNHNHSLHSCTSVLAAHSPGAGADEKNVTSLEQLAAHSIVLATIGTMDQEAPRQGKRQTYHKSQGGCDAPLDLTQEGPVDGGYVGEALFCVKWARSHTSPNYVKYRLLTRLRRLFAESLT
ncbi:MAG: hypothetical protein WDW38_003825 [Sanguina aurantia]